MKRLGTLLAVLALAVAAPALAQKRVTVKVVSFGLSASAPSTAADGVDITNAEGFAVMVSAPASQTITGGSLLCYWYAPITSEDSSTGVTYEWVRCGTALDFTPATGARRAPSYDYEPLVGVSRVFFRTSSVTVSSGSAVDVALIVRKKQ